MQGSSSNLAEPDQLAPKGLPLSPHNSSSGGAEFPVVGLGASAGGLDACKKLVAALPAASGMAFILVQHLDPTHESMMVDLLSGHTSMTVRQAKGGMPVEREHLYIIPPATYLSVVKGALHLSAPHARHGARLPFDFLLHSLAAEFGARTICVVLSGTGADGSLGLKAVKERGGLVIAQDPDEAGYDGMPRSAIMTGAVDLVLPVTKIPEALVKHDWRIPLPREPGEPRAMGEGRDPLAEIIALLRTKTAHDFRLYKPGTLRRRTERRMALAGIEADNMELYLDRLRQAPGELDLLAKDLLINVTTFFRDSKVFDLLAEKTVPDLVRNHSPDRPLRIWIAGCSTGEETYSLAMLFREQIAATNRNIRLQIFASDVDPDAVDRARDGVYSESMVADVSAARLARFFTKEDHSYRVSPELRSAVVFTVQDVLADPPFSRLDLVSCRNLLIYLQPEAQARVITLFHFALREGGILLLGSAETIDEADGRFEVIAKPERLFLHIGRYRAGELGFQIGPGGRTPRHRSADHDGARSTPLADLCRGMVLESYAPAAVLVNRRYECLYSLGPTDTYLRVPPGQPIHDLLTMAREGVRTKLRSALQRAVQENKRVVSSGGWLNRNDDTLSFSIAVHPVTGDGEDLLLVCFINEARRERGRGNASGPEDAPRVAELEREIQNARAELQGAIHNLETSSEEQKAINQEALSVNEEFQATNEELLASKEELQSLNEELTALNGQLQETLERQRTASNDLQNILYSTDVATLFLDTKLNIRFFTPASRAMFRMIPGDIGRPLQDLSLLAADGSLPADARSVLQTRVLMEREIEGQNRTWYSRRILPYRTQDNGIEGVVITFADITERKLAADALEAAKRDAQLANVAKSHFLAAASHDLRQPLQTLVLLQGLLATVEGDKTRKLATRFEETLSAMAGMLNALLDINQIEQGAISAEVVSFPIDDLLGRMREEFAYHAQAQRLVLRAVPCGLTISSDPGLLEQMIRNLLSNALKYTRRGKLLLGCRPRGGTLRIEVWDTGIGIPDAELQAIFEEYHQLDNPAREKSRGLGLGLSIVQRLGTLLGHRVSVRSRVGKGSVFSIEVPLSSGDNAPQIDRHRHGGAPGMVGAVARSGEILIVEDDPELRELLELLLIHSGYRAATATDGIMALDMVAGGALTPDLALVDYNLPNGMNGLQVGAALRKRLRRDIPVIILTGDISTETKRAVELQNCVPLNKPVKLKELTAVIEHLLSEPAPQADEAWLAAPDLSIVRHSANQPS